MMMKSAVAEHAWENHHLGGDHSTGPWQRTGAVGEEGPAHPDDTLRRVLQPGWRTGSPWLLVAVMRRQGGRNNPHRSVTSNDVYPQ